MKALLIVDVQNDFCTGGALATRGGEEVAPVINNIADKFDLVVASKDWHPEETVHFEKWPVHCVAGTHGAEFHAELNSKIIDQVVEKGTANVDDGYSAFEATNLDLVQFLKSKEIDTVYVCGIATDYCVLSSALDAQKHGFKTVVIKDAIRAVNLKEGDGDRAIEQMKEAGCEVVHSNQI
ncbi:nicotinamidase [Galbibacter sp.]|uniref:nicotinamidase n=1 Tax=Galbibacter sp. TaxID=2918471 RepID=UPI002C145146|nr:nicotinamidase [Galbibacter sp.]HLV63156.1 nicotinamidase [Galbibacter sp.]